MNNECAYWSLLQELQDRVEKAKDSNEEMIKIRKEIVDFHGEMVLLENYSALNYTGSYIHLLLNGSDRYLLLLLLIQGALFEFMKLHIYRTSNS